MRSLHDYLSQGRPKVLYIAGFGSGPKTSRTFKIIKEFMKDKWDVKCPDLDLTESPMTVHESISRMAQGCDMAIGSSLGGFYVLGIEGDCKKIAINPCLSPVKELPGLTSAIGDKAMKEFRRLEKKMEEIEETEGVYGIFGKDDDLFSYIDEFKKKWGEDSCTIVEGGHKLEKEVLVKSLKKALKALEKKSDMLKESLINEGGLAGHMAHPQDYDDFTKKDLQSLVMDIFSGRVENMTEKVDGLNIQASVNKEGKTVFMRNKTDIRSGGMSIEDLEAKYANKPAVRDTFMMGALTLDKLCQKLGKKWFWPLDDGRVQLTLNCECIIAGRTNIMPYAHDQVDIHSIFVYHDGEKMADGSRDLLRQVDKALEDIPGLRLTPTVVIWVTGESDRIARMRMEDIEGVFRGRNITIAKWKRERWEDWLISNGYIWVLQSREGADNLFLRWMGGEGSQMNMRDLKKIYKDNEKALAVLDRDHKKMVAWVMAPLDRVVLNIGNDAIGMCKWLVNSGTDADKAVNELKRDLTRAIDQVKRSSDPKAQEELSRQLERLASADNRINPAEGIVFTYRGRLMKLTGSFAPLNRILGDLKWRAEER